MCLVEHAGKQHKLSTTFATNNNNNNNKQTSSRSTPTTCSNSNANNYNKNSITSYSTNNNIHNNNNIVVVDINTQQRQEQEQQQQKHHQSLHTECITPTFNAKYRRKCLLLLSLLLFHGCFSGLHSASAYNCTTNPCQNDGQCLDGQCICADGWQGPACQFCGGKVR